MLSWQLKKKTFLPSLIFVTIYLGFSFSYKVFIQGTCGLKPIVTDIEVYFKEMVWFFIVSSSSSGKEPVCSYRKLNQKTHIPPLHPGVICAIFKGVSLSAAVCTQ